MENTEFRVQTSPSAAATQRKNVGGRRGGAGQVRGGRGGGRHGRGGPKGRGGRGGGPPGAGSATRAAKSGTMVAAGLAQAEAEVAGARDVAAEIIENAAERVAEVPAPPPAPKRVGPWSVNKTPSVSCQTDGLDGELDPVAGGAQNGAVRYNLAAVKVVRVGQTFQLTQVRDSSCQCDFLPGTLFGPQLLATKEDHVRTAFPSKERSLVVEAQILSVNGGDQDTNLMWAALAKSVSGAYQLLGSEEPEWAGQLSKMDVLGSFASRVWSGASYKFEFEGPEYVVGGEADVRPIQHSGLLQSYEVVIQMIAGTNTKVTKRRFVCKQWLHAAASYFAGREYTADAVARFVSGVLAPRTNMPAALAASVQAATIEVACQFISARAPAPHF